MIDIDLCAREILAKAAELTTVDIFEGDIPDGYQPPLIPNSSQIRPYVVINFAGLTDTISHGKGITGAADDAYGQQFTTHAVASTQETARETSNAILKKLLGFEPTNAGEITPAFFGGIGENSSLSDPSRYSAAQAYKFIAI